jgi:NitT/TauT family transport system permease protein
MMRNPPPPIVTREGDNVAARPSSGWLGVPVALALLGGAWIAVASSGRASMMVPPPSATFDALAALMRDPAFHDALGATMLAAGTGFLIALVLGGVVAAVFAEALRMATLTLLGVPAAALMPLALIWLGLGSSLGIVGAALLAFGPIVVGFAADGAARRPGVAVGAAMALNGALVAEMVSGRGGLGYLTMQAVAQFDMAKAAAVTLAIVAAGIVTVLIVHVLFPLFVRDDGAF